MENRILAWDGCKNVRDLGGLRMPDGRETRWRSIVRSDTPTRLTAAGWAALHDYGIRTIITLRTHGLTEDELNVISPYADVAIHQVAIEDITDADFVQQWVDNGLWSTPVYYQDALQRWPERHAAVVSAIARAQPGGILFHCIRGHDRTGIISLVLLALTGVAVDDIVADYALSLDPDRDKILAQRNSSVPEVIRATLNSLDIEEYLGMGGVNRDEMAAVRRRLLG